MSLEINIGKPTPSPFSIECRSLLRDIYPVRESRKGKPRFIVLYLLAYTVIYMPLVGTLLFYLADQRLDPYALISITMMLIGLVFLVAAISYEYKLFSQNHIDKIVSCIQPLLEKEERFLSMSIGLATSFNTPKWIIKEISEFCYFIFTSDRLLVFTFNDSINNINQLNKQIELGNLENIINESYTCSLENEQSIKIGGLIRQPFLMLTHTKVTITPVHESDDYTWILANKHSNNVY